jgi:TATA-binding protein-associated factor
VLTGTPLQNKVSELWSIFDFLMPGFLEEEAVFNKKYN